MRFVFLFVFFLLAGCAGNFYCAYESESEFFERVIKEVRDAEST